MTIGSESRAHPRANHIRLPNRPQNRRGGIASIEQADLDIWQRETVGALGNRGADEQASVRATANRDPTGRRTSLRYKPLGSGNKVIERVLAIFAFASPMPLLTEFGPSAQSRDSE